MLRLLLVDDEPLALQGLRKALETTGQAEVAGTARTIGEAVEFLADHAVDGVFLDIRLPGEDGFALWKKLAEPPPVIFVTAYAEHAVQAFEVRAVDYLLKPVRSRRLREALARLQALREPAAEHAPLKPQDRICLRTPERTVVAPLAEILWIAAEGDFSRVVLRRDPALLIGQSLGHFTRTLPLPPFLRVDRSVLLNVAEIRELEISPSRGATVFFGGCEQSLALGRAAVRRLRQALEESGQNLLSRPTTSADPG
jgi:two-component system LytT family response regulator